MKKHLIVIIFLILASGSLRFVNLGYSDYIGDEHKSFIQPKPGQGVWHFFMEQRKGPMQFLVSLIPYSLTRDYTNELAQRIPFSLISVLSVAIFYILILKITRSALVSFISGLLFSVNGFMVGFGRISQYQNLNMIFSFLSLYFFYDLVETTNKNLIKSSILGSVFFILSTLSHWDSIFIILPILIILYKFFKSNQVTRLLKIEVFKYNLIIIFSFFILFLTPYAIYQFFHEENKQYFSRRISIGEANIYDYIITYNLYNPFISIWFVSAFAVLGIFRLKKNYIFTVWSLISFLFFLVFVRKPGTHIYNFIIPMFVLCASFIESTYLKLNRYFKFLFLFLVFIVISFLYYQSFMIFVDHSVEYPWNQKTLLTLFRPKKVTNKYSGVSKKEKVQLLNLVTPKYTYEQKLPLFGFPHKRMWNEINKWVNEHNVIEGKKVSYITNEAKTISDWYMNAIYQKTEPYYAIGIKKPLSFVNDYTFSDIPNKKSIYKIVKDNETVVVIYLVQ